MRFGELRRVLQTVVLASVPFGCAGDEPPDCGTWSETGTTTEIIRVRDLPTTLRLERCRADVDACVELCRYALREVVPGTITNCSVALAVNEVLANVDYKVTHDAGVCPGIGRRPQGLRDPEPVVADAVGRWFARAAWLEAASIPAFIYLAHELERFGAPVPFVHAAVAGASDEVRHAQAMAALARRYGASPPPVDIAPARIRTLEEFALENAVEGCVHETWGAATALWQSRHAGDAELREVFRTIASDELRHAELAWEIDRWVCERLDRSARQRVNAARRAAAHAVLTAEHGGEDGRLGLPAGANARGLLARLGGTLWRAA